VVSPKGEKQVLQLEQTGPGHYDAVFPTKEVGAYLMNLTDRGTGQSQALGLSVNYSPEFDDSGPNLNLLGRLAELGGGKVLDPQVDNPFLHAREKTFRAFDLRDWLLRLAILLFVLDVGVRRIQVDHAEWVKAMGLLRRWLMPWQTVPRTKAADESLGALLSRRDRVRAQRPTTTAAPELFQPQQTPVVPEPPPSPSGASGGAPPPSPIQPVEEPKTKPEPPASTTSRLLDAKRRARKRTEGDKD